MKESLVLTTPQSTSVTRSPFFPSRMRAQRTRGGAGPRSKSRKKKAGPLASSTSSVESGGILGAARLLRERRQETASTSAMSVSDLDETRSARETGESENVVSAHQREHGQRRQAMSAPAKTAPDEIEVMRRHLEQTRERRIAMERIAAEMEKKDRRVQEMEQAVQKLRSENSKVKIEALQREKALRESLIKAEQGNKELRERENAVADELRQLLEIAQRENSEISSELARSKAQIEAERNRREKAEEDAEESLRTLQAEVMRLEDENSTFKDYCNEKRKALERLQSKMETDAITHSRQTAESEKQLILKREEVSDLKEKVESLKIITKKQQEQLNSKISIIDQLEQREALLQTEKQELESYTEVLRGQLSSHETGGVGLSALLREMKEKLLNVEEENESLRDSLMQSTMQHNLHKDLSKREQEESGEVRASLQRASAHRKRMEVQLKNLSVRIQGLQAQLVHEMEANANLTKQLEDERNARTEIAKQRLRLLEQVYEEEDKLKETLEQPFFESLGEHQRTPRETGSLLLNSLSEEEASGFEPDLL